MSDEEVSSSSENSYEEDESDESSDLPIEPLGPVRTEAHKRDENDIQISLETKNYIARFNTDYIRKNGDTEERAWSLINPAGVHPKDNTKSIFQYNLKKLKDTVEDKPWTAEGADITDWFNYGFNEHTWDIYRRRMKKRYKNIIKLNKL